MKLSTTLRVVLNHPCEDQVKPDRRRYFNKTLQELEEEQGKAIDPNLCYEITYDYQARKFVPDSLQEIPKEKVYIDRYDTSHHEELYLLEFLYHTWNFCGCGYSITPYLHIFDFLKQCAQRATFQIGEPDPYHDREKTDIKSAPDWIQNMYYAQCYIFEKRPYCFTEHGSTILYSWLSWRGEIVYRILSRFREEDLEFHLDETIYCDPYNMEDEESIAFYTQVESLLLEK